MKFECPSCARKTTASEVETMDLGMISCRDCGTQYHILGYEVDEQDRSHKEISHLPKGISLSQRPEGTRIVFKENKGRGLAVIWAFLVSGISALFLNATPAATSENEFVGWIIVALIYVSVPFALYRTFRQRFLDILPTKMIFGYSLFGWVSFPREFLIKDFDQFFVKKHARKRDGKRYASYSLNGRKKDNTSLRLFDHIKGFNIAFFIEQELEDYYGIVDETLYGEFDPRKELDRDFHLGDTYVFVRRIIKNTKDEYAREGVAYSKNKNLYKDNLEMLVKKMIEAKNYGAY